VTPESRGTEDGPLHYIDCDRLDVHDYGLRQGTCDCTATQDVAALVEAVQEARALVHHHVDPVIGWLRYAEQTPDFALNYAAAVDHLRGAEDAADAMLGEPPMREQIAALKAAANNGGSHVVG
jgi:hypothetical protein